jgi:hypothetical protein
VVSNGPHGRALRGVALWRRRPTLLDCGVAITSNTPPPRKQRRGAVFIKKEKNLKTGGLLAAFSFFSSPAKPPILGGGEQAELGLGFECTWAD